MVVCTLLKHVTTVGSPLIACNSCTRKWIHEYPKSHISNCSTTYHPLPLHFLSQEIKVEFNNPLSHVNRLLNPQDIEDHRVIADFGTSDACQNQPGRMETSHSGGTQSLPKGSPSPEYLLNIEHTSIQDQTRSQSQE
ncbi:hypothetical protein Leryth_027095 [Lithospermum erythrorhizon]|nr:hypothetical protein Leryth_027095 [Lithospermum erythrorhizon]